jgi:RNA polymerase sigma factor (sigma-70 family)
MSSEKSEQARWFTEQVSPHEPSLRAYLRGSFPSVRDVDDVMQESLLRVWRARAAQPILSARAFLFKVARHVALDLVRRDRSSPIDAVGDLSALPVIEDRLGVAESADINEKVHLLAEAVAALPYRCREIVVLRKLKGLSQKEVAAQLGLSEKTVEEQVSRGVKRCGAFLRKRGIRDLYGS